MRIAFATFGCKINQYETEGMQQVTAEGGNRVVPFDGEADVYVINTCSVTARSDYQCRQAIRAAVRRNAGAHVIVTGCYAETRQDEVRAIPGVSAILPSRDKMALTRYLPPDQSAASGSVKDLLPLQKPRTRTFLKIQDGCDNRCSYCIVPLARGSSRSVPLEKVLERFDAAVARKAPEVVLSGIHIGKYGSDLVPNTSLTKLLQLLDGRREDSTRIRLSSIEPTEVTPEMIGMLGTGLCKHLHIPLQSGDDGILVTMNRHYSADLYRQLVERIAAQKPGIAIGADVLVGFPGEGDEEFQHTYDLIESLPISHLHVFSFSPRPGTPASAMPMQVSEPVKKSRNERIRELGLKKNLIFRKGLVGQELAVVIESRTDARKGQYIGITDNYIKLTVQGAKKEDIGKNLKVRITEVRDKETDGIIL